MSWSGWAKSLSLALLVFVLAAFVAQNVGRTTSLSLNLGLAAWELRAPVSVPLLMGVCLVVGLLLAGGWGWSRSLALQRRVRKLEQELAFAGTRNEDWTKKH